MAKTVQTPSGGLIGNEINMTLKPGYKQTEVGVIPEEWETRPCSELSERIMVGIVIRPTQYYVRHGVPAFRSANIREDGINDFDLVYISDASNALLAKSQTRTGDVLTVRTGYPGTSAVVRPVHAGCNCIDILITRPSRKLDSEWLAIWINSSFGKEQVLRNQGGLAQKHFNVGDMRNLVVALPPLPEQRAIATALSDMDALLAALDRLIAKQRDFKQAAMQQLLTGQTRLPGFKGEWVVKPMSEVCWFQEGPGVRNTQFTVSGIKLLNGTNIFRGILNLDTTSRFISEREARGPYAHFLADEGDIVLASSGITVERLHEKVAFVRSQDLPFCMNTSTIRFKPSTGILAPTFLFQFLTSDRFKRMIGGVATGSAQLNFGPSHIAKVEISVPPLPEQTAIAGVLSDMDTELAALERRRDKTRALKQGMMQELLTGRTRLV